ncbi:hypothetical protein ACQEU3_40855 [Spirillospora sp. CA-253888]
MIAKEGERHERRRHQRAVPVDGPAASRRFRTAHPGLREGPATGGLVRLARDVGAAGIWLRRRPPAEPPCRSAVVTFTVTGLLTEHARLCREGATAAAPLRPVAPGGLEIELAAWSAPAGA